MWAYEEQKHSVVAAMVMEIFVPGLGSIYGDHWQGALLNWALEVGGILVIVSAIHTSTTSNDYGSTSTPDIDGSKLAVGLLMVVGGRTYGLVDAHQSNKEYNQKLRRKLGLPEWTAFSIQPIRTREGMAYAPSLHFMF